MQTLLTLPYLTLYLHRQGPLPVLEFSWRSYVASAGFRTATELALTLSRQHGVKAWLGDDRLLGAVRPVDAAWAEEHVLGPLSTSGLERLAVLDSAVALNKFILGDMHKHVEAACTFELRHFTDLAEARAWASGSDFEAPA